MMKKGILLAVSALLVANVFAQKPSPEKKITIKIDGSIRNFTGKTIYVHHRVNEQEMLDSTLVSNGKFSLNLNFVH